MESSRLALSIGMDIFHPLRIRRVAFVCAALLLPGIVSAGEPGKLTREVWTNLPGSKLTDFSANSRSWQFPNTVSTFSGAASPRNIANNFASRIRGYITAPVTGNYTFWLASDDDGELRISPNDSKFGRVKIASVSGWTNPQAWDVKTSQKSALIPLVAGQRYFIEALHKEGGGLDHLEIAWQVPGGIRELIPASALESFTADFNDADNDELPDSWEAAHGFSLSDNGTAIPAQLPLADPDHDGYSNFEEGEYGTDPNVRGGVPGSLLLETWNGIAGASVEDLTFSPRFTGAPNKSEFIFSATTPANRADNFGARMRGYIIAPATGTYTFYVAGDDSCQLFLSTSESQFAKQKIAGFSGWSSVQQWTKYPSQKSTAISLVAGQKYYIEALEKEGGGGDHLEIGWQTPTTAAITIIPGSALESYALDAEDPDGDNMPASWEIANGLDPNGNDSAADPDGDGFSNEIEYLTGSNPQVKGGISGGLAMELWTGMKHYSTRSMVADSAFYAPAASLALISGASTAQRLSSRTYIAGRMRGYLVAPQSGDYRFWISARNGAELNLSTDATKYRKRPIAEINPDIGGGHGIDIGSSNLWDCYPAQMSQAIHLDKDQKYFFEALLANGHVGGAHVSLAWAQPGGLREPIPAACLQSYLQEAEDADDDYLPDSWESLHGLNPQDNGRLNLARQGERGDFDGDGLCNREEYLLASDPKNSDTDGDGFSDGQEVNTLRSNPLVTNAIKDNFVNEVALADFFNGSTTWTMTTGGLLADSFRGEACWNFAVPSAGNWLLRLDTELMGATYGNEEVPMVIKVDGHLIQRSNLRFGSAKLATLQALTQWLTAGTHQVSILVDNAIARRTVRLVALKVYAPAEATATAMLSQGNRLIPHAATSRTSPAFVEGYAREVAAVNIGGSPVNHGTGNGHWFANLALANQAAPQNFTLHYEQGWETTDTLIWRATNVMDAETLTIRQGDNLRIGAWCADTALASTVSLSSGGRWNLTGDQAVILIFPVAGTFTVNGSLQNGAAAILTVKVVAAPNFPGGTVDTLEDRVRKLTFNAAPEVQFDTPEDLCRLITTRTTPSSVTLSILPSAPQDLGVAARLGGRGPILGIQRVNVIGVSDALQNDLTSVAPSGISGYKIFNSPLTILNLPDGGRIDVSIFRAGVMFPNGSTLKSIFPADLINGSVNLEFLFPIGLSGGYCHNLRVYDRNGHYLGGR